MPSDWQYVSGNVFDLVGTVGFGAQLDDLNPAGNHLKRDGDNGAAINISKIENAVETTFADIRAAQERDLFVQARACWL